MYAVTSNESVTVLLALSHVTELATLLTLSIDVSDEQLQSLTMDGVCTYVCMHIHMYTHT